MDTTQLFQYDLYPPLISSGEDATTTTQQAGSGKVPMMEHLEMPITWLFRVLSDSDLDLPVEARRFEMLMRSYVDVPTNAKVGSFMVPVLLASSPYVAMIRSIAHLARSQTLCSSPNPEIIRMMAPGRKVFETFGINKKGLCFIEWEPSIVQPRYVLHRNQHWENLS
jgi:hypothetical protein